VASATPFVWQVKQLLTRAIFIYAFAWFFHPLLFMLATSWVILILARWDFFSRSLRPIVDGGRA